ncbi:hypothetical protein EYR40_009277 [Pleurotus pulmonarius]|nr:hypothetical protein EYR40_009277 [Pleurotus pulmonarius]
MPPMPHHRAFRAPLSMPPLQSALPAQTTSQAGGAILDIAHETKGMWIGPCPLDEFFASMQAPSTSKSDPGIPATYFRDMRVSCERDFIECLDALVGGRGIYPPLLPDYSIVDISHTTDTVFEDGAQIWPAGRHFEKGFVSTSTPNTLDLALLAYQRAHACHRDIVDDTAHHSAPLSPSAREAPYETTHTTPTLIRGELANHAAQIFRQQHRTHLYMVYAFHPFVRFIRWDRAGAIVTQRVNYVEDCTPLVRFFSLFDRLESAGKGFDITVQPAPQVLAERAKERLRRWAPRAEQRVFMMDVPSGSTTRQFLVWGALTDPEDLFGRATRGYPAVEVVDGILSETPVFLKDQWRDVSGRAEVETLAELNEKRVSHVPTLLCGGDLPGQETKTREMGEGTWRVGHKRIGTRVHTRFVVAEVGRPLEQFPSSFVMLRAVYDAFQGELIRT